MDIQKLGENIEADYAYYNIIIANQTIAPIPAAFQEDRTIPFLEQYQDFQLQIARFKVPSILIPLFYFPDYIGLNSPYTITIELGGNIGTANVLFDPTLISATTSDRAIFYYSQFLNMVNVALSVATTNFIATVPPAPYNTINSPEIWFDPTTKLFSLVLDATAGITYYPTPASLKIYMNSALYYFFIGFPSFKTNIPNQENLLIVSSNASQFFPAGGILLYDYIIQPSDHSSLYMWQKLSRIVIGTTMPIVQEDIGIEVREGEANNGTPITQAILTDFEVEPSPQEQREYIYYTPEASNRYVNFLGSGDIRRVDLFIYWQDNDLRTYRMMLPPSFEVYIKLQFKRKKSRDQLQRTPRYKFISPQVDFHGSLMVNRNGGGTQCGTYQKKGRAKK